jgi:hypothetical protein
MVIENKEFIQWMITWCLDFCALTPPGSRGVAGIYFSADQPPLSEPILVLNGEGKGLVNSMSVVSQVASTYAPPGASLISATVLGNPDMSDEELEIGVRDQLSDWFGRSIVDRWRHLRTYRISHALPDIPSSGFKPEKPARLQKGLYLCGDYLDIPSINGAMASGRRAAEAVIEDLKI